MRYLLKNFWKITALLGTCIACSGYGVENFNYQGLNLSPYTSILEDTSGTLSYDDIQHPDQQFKSSRSNQLPFFQGPKKYWLKIDTSSLPPADEDRYVLYIPYRPLDRISMFLEDDVIERIQGNKRLVADKKNKKNFVTEYNLTWWEHSDGKIITELKYGLLEKARFKNGSHVHYRFWLPKKFLDKKIPLYLHIENNTQALINSLPMYILDTTNYLRKNLILHLIGTAYYSVMGCFLLFTFLIYLRLKEGFLLIYSAYIFITILLSTFIDGTYYSVINEQAGDVSYLIFRSLFLIQNSLHLLFVMQLIKRENIPNLPDSVGQNLSLFGGIFAIITLILPLNFWMNTITLIYSIIIIFCIIWISSIATFKKIVHGRTLMLMITPYSVFLLLLTASWSGTLPDTAFSPWLAHCAYLSEALLFSLILASQFIQIQGQVVSANQRHRSAEQKAYKEKEAHLEKSRFLARASHDLRQPLHSISLLAATLQIKTKHPEQKELIHAMQKSIRSMHSMFTDMLDLSKIDVGILSPKLEIFSLDEVLKNLHQELSPQAEAKHLIFRIHVPKKFLVYSDFMLLKRILRNLIVNAINYTSVGSILIGCRFFGKYIRIDIIDSGTGIHLEQQQNIFNEFFRGDAHSSQDGLGLGLAIVKQLANSLHHPIEVVSIPGQGSRFSIILPLTIQSPHTKTINSEQLLADNTPLYDLSGYLIVVIDDDEAIRYSLSLYLKSFGCRVLSGVSSEDVLNQLDAHQLLPDFLIADYSLGHAETGTAAIKKIFEHFGDNTIPVLMITGDTSTNTLLELQKGHFDVLNKPIEPDQLRQRIEEKLFT